MIDKKAKDAIVKSIDRMFTEDEEKLSQARTGIEAFGIARHERGLRAAAEKVNSMIINGEKDEAVIINAVMFLYTEADNALFYAVAGSMAYGAKKYRDGIKDVYTAMRAAIYGE